MIHDFLTVIMTKNLAEQQNFYQNILGLDLIFDNTDTLGFGKDDRLFVVLRQDSSANSHHLSEHKGPQILTFKCKGNVKEYAKKIKEAGFTIRDTVTLSEHNTQYLFIEDFDCNEICLDFPLR